MMASISIVLQVLLALVFLLVGGLKIAGVKRMVTNYIEHYHYPRWFLPVTGIVEWLGAIGMLVGIWYPVLAALAGVWLGITMLAAAWTHLFRAHDSLASTMPALVLCLLAIIVGVLNWSALTHLLIAVP